MFETAFKSLVEVNILKNGKLSFTFTAIWKPDIKVYD